MKLIIDIPEVFYEYCKAQEDAIEIQLAVKNGTPLDDIKAEIVKKCDAFEKCNAYECANGLNWALKVIDKHMAEGSEE